MADDNKTETEKNCQIKVTRNGPYLVKGKIPISEQIIIADAEGTATEWRTGKKYPSQKIVALCRCGQSKNKPFCDGTHVKIKFDGKETATTEPCLKRAIEIDGPALKLQDVEDLCASARFCHRAGGIWSLIPKSDGPQAKQTATEEARDCPSGRLIIYDKEKKQHIEPKLELSIGIIQDPQKDVGGPIWLKGGISVESAEGKVYEVRNRVTLCRCGKSKNKPFCDSSHYPE
jgi:CDGSH-type Zn-finger protein